MPYYLNLSILSNNLNILPKAQRARQLSAEARRMVSLCAGRPLAEGDIASEEQGRPFFPNRDADLSISHSGALAAVSFVSGKDRRTGCDVELVRPRTGAAKIAKEFFTAPERSYIEHGGSFDMTRFYHIWTLKECCIKLRGLSVFDMAGAPSFMCGDGLYTFGVVDAFSIFFNLYELSGSAGERYILAAAIERTEIEGTAVEQPEIRWFSQERLDCKSIANINAALSPAETVKPKI